MIILTSGFYLYISIQYNNLFFNTQNQKYRFILFGKEVSRLINDNEK